jgi:2-polyprenyl-6-methoxyphenol hydroxylase-like FAD-dependent oxidoreductase
MFTGRDGVHYEHGIPPGQVRPELIISMKREARALLPAMFSDVIERMQGMFVQAIYDLESEHMACGRVALIGDAAFVARPHCGAGVSKAADDAAALTDALVRHQRVVEGLRAFSAVRVDAGRAAVKWAARLGSYFQMDDTGHRAGTFDPARPPVDPHFIVSYTGIELSDLSQEVVP